MDWRFVAAGEALRVVDMLRVLAKNKRETVSLTA